MFKSKRPGAQARRTQSSPKSSSFQWPRSYNWILLLVGLLTTGISLAQPLRWLPIGKIQVHGSFENLAREEVEAALKPYIGQGFLSLDISQLQRGLLVTPWIDAVSIRRVWPDQIQVSIREMKPIARWGDKHLLSDTAKVYRADTGAFGHLPMVYADGHRPDWAMQLFVRLKARFNRIDENLVGLQVDRRGALKIQLIDGLQIKLGRDDIDYKVDRLIRIYPQQILPRREQIERLDLRYSNGFAVAWKKGVLQGRDKASIWSNSNV